MIITLKEAYEMAKDQGKGMRIRTKESDITLKVSMYFLNEKYERYCTKHANWKCKLTGKDAAHTVDVQLV